MTTGMIVVFGIIAVAVVLFVTEPFPIEVTALLVMVALIVLGPWTQVSVEEGVSGFSNPAALTVLAMLILSEGVRRTGVVQTVADWAIKLAGNSQRRQLALTMGMSGPVSGFINNTPVVALLVPVVSKMAHRGNTSPSKLLLPLSYASMFGGMLTMIGTSTNLLASDISGRTIGQEFSLFEFTHLGVIVLVTGMAFLMFAAPRLLPERVKPRESSVESFEMGGFLSEVQVATGSPLIGQSLSESLLTNQEDFEVVRVRRGDELYRRNFEEMKIQAGDDYLIRASQQVLAELIHRQGLEIAAHRQGGDRESYSGRDDAEMAQMVVPRNSSLESTKVGDLAAAEDQPWSILAVRRRRENFQESLDEIRLRAGDMLLGYGTEEIFESLSRQDDIVLVSRLQNATQRRSKVPHALAIIFAVIAVAALDILPILVTAMAGAVIMMMVGIVRPGEVYDSLRWEVYFLLAGIIPLGIALEQTGAAEYLGDLIASTGEALPAIAVLWVFYLATGLITAVISNNASVVLMIPVAIETAGTIEANAFAFVMAVTFAASTAFLSPIGYQTNLFVYGPGNYKVSDFLRLGAPLQLFLSVITVAGIALFWGLT